jgi:hypothetical protein
MIPQKPWRASLARPDEDVWAYVVCVELVSMYSSISGL